MEKAKHTRAYLINAGILLSTAIAYAVTYGIFKAGSAAAVLHILSNAFLVPGVLMAGFGGLSWIASKGGYDSLRYVFYNFGLHTIWVTNPKKTRYDSLYDYKAAKDEKGRVWFPRTLTVGLAGIVLAGAFMVIYLMVV